VSVLVLVSASVGSSLGGLLVLLVLLVLMMLLLLLLLGGMPKGGVPMWISPR
jgi:hypothetical protein